MKRVVLYVEGGGDTADQKAQLRSGFDGLFSSIKQLARDNGVSFSVVCAGDRNMAHRAYVNAKKAGDAAVLLVDSEEAFPSEGQARERVQFLTNRDKWDLSGSDANCVHLMVQCTETWVVADPDTLANFYGANFARNKLPSRINLEDEPKKDVFKKLQLATRNSSKGEYAKIRHAKILLAKIKIENVRQRCPHFGYLHEFLGKLVQL